MNQLNIPCNALELGRKGAIQRPREPGPSQLPPPKQHSVPCRGFSWHSQDPFFSGDLHAFWDASMFLKGHLQKEVEATCDVQLIALFHNDGPAKFRFQAFN